MTDVFGFDIVTKESREGDKMYLRGTKNMKRAEMTVSTLEWIDEKNRIMEQEAEKKDNHLQELLNKANVPELGQGQTFLNDGTIVNLAEMNPEHQDFAGVDLDSLDATYDNVVLRQGWTPVEGADEVAQDVPAGAEPNTKLAFAKKCAEEEAGKLVAVIPSGSLSIGSPRDPLTVRCLSGFQFGDGTIHYCTAGYLEVAADRGSICRKGMYRTLPERFTADDIYWRLAAIFRDMRKACEGVGG